MLTKIEVTGELVLIPPGIPNLDENEEKSLLKNLSSEKPLFNAENLTITQEGQVFVTGSSKICEIVKDGDKYKLESIDIDTPDGPRNYFRNGITVQGNSLYLACTDIHKCENSLFPSLFRDIRTIDQKWSGFMLAGISQWGFGYQVESYILRADLNELQFIDEIPLPKIGKCFANGLVSDENALYVANSFGTFTDQNTFFKILLSNDGDMTEVLPITFSSPNYDKPNGIKIRGDYLYYTCLQLFPIMTSSLKKIKIDKNNGGMGKADVIYQSPFSFFDDFDIVDNGFVIADIVDIPHSSGCLRFVSKDDGKLKGVFRHKNLIKPSSVKVVEKDTKLFKAGDTLITEKGLHCVSWLRPDAEWRQWLVGSLI